MAFAKDRPCSFHGSYMFEEASSSPIQFPSDPYAALYSLQEDDIDDHIISINQKVHGSQSPPLSSSCSETSSNGFALHGGGSSYPQPKEANKTTTTCYVDGFMHANGSFLTFKNQNCYDNYPLWEGSKMYGEGPPVARESAALEQTSFSKNRPLMREENMQTLKKQCTRKQTNKPKLSKSAKDPQSIAAKNRRERISERLKILQDIVPNGSKVDLVTMLEKAINYVKFLQLQVKVLATDEFWPADGGMLPDITQVREAIDAILSTQRNINNYPTQSNEKVIEEIIDSE